ncbi:MAG: ion channel [Cyanobacteria bacterium P01_D01_bin.50]
MNKLFSKIKGWFQNTWEVLQRENLTYLIRPLLILGVFVVILSIGVYFIENSIILKNFSEQDSTTSIRKPFDVFWWIIVTVTTVGYGDKFPKTIPGRFIAVFVIFYGTTVISVINGIIIDSIFKRRNKQEQGLIDYKFEKHIILCEWNYRSKMVIKQLRLHPKTKRVRIVLIADIDKKPIDDNNLFFVKGQVNEETLRKANLEKAKTVIILGDDHLGYENRDVKVASSTLTVETINPNAYKIVELLDEKKAYYYRALAYANEIILSSDFSSYVIAHSTIDYGISTVISNLLSQFYGANQLHKIPVPTDDMNCAFMDVFVRMKQDQEIIIVAIQQGEEGKVITNPDSDYQLTADDYLIVIADDN